MSMAFCPVCQRHLYVARDGEPACPVCLTPVTRDQGDTVQGQGEAQVLVEPSSDAEDTPPLEGKLAQ